MASKNATEKTKTGNGNANNGAENRHAPSFVKYRLSEDEMSQAREACTQFSDIGEIIAQLIDEGYKVSASHDNYGGGTQVFLTPVGNTGENAGWTLTARAPTLLSAVGVLAFKHYTLFAQVWPKDVSERQGSNWG